jgi:hypothetical protein
VELAPFKEEAHWRMGVNMLGYGLLGTLVVICLIVWIIKKL